MVTTRPAPLERFPKLRALDVRSYDPASGQCECICPAHDDHNASLSLNIGDNGEPVLYCHAGCTYEEVCAALSLGKAAGRPMRKHRRKVASKPPLPASLHDQDKPLQWHDQFMAGARSDFFEYLTVQRGLRAETIEFFKIGTDAERITIPIRYRGKWRQVRRYLPDGEPKMLNIKGFGRALLAFTETLTGNTLPVLVTEGELDAVLAWQEAAGRFAVVTGTGGAGVVPRDLSALNGRDVFVAYDLDDAGRKGAQKFAAAARAAGARTYVLDLERLGLK